MNKQEEIRSGVEKIIHQAMYASARIGAESYTDLIADKDVEELINYLHSQGVVLLYEGSGTGCGCEMCLSEAGLSRQVVEPLVIE